VTESLITFALVAALLTITPGADTMLVLSAAARSGASRGVATAAGTVTGVYAWGVAAAAGASAVLTAYSLLKAAGAAYLLWLGVSALRSSFKPGPEVVDGTAAEPGFRTSLRRSYARGLFTNLLNPKIGVFYISFLPQFLPSDVAALPAGVLLTSVHVVEGLLFLAAISYLAERAGGWLRRPHVARALDRICATVFIGFGVRLAVTR